MAWDKDSDGVGADGSANGAGGGGRSVESSGDVGVGEGLAMGDIEEGAPDGFLEGGAFGCDVEGVGLIVEDVVEDVDGETVVA